MADLNCFQARMIRLVSNDNIDKVEQFAEEESEGVALVVVSGVSEVVYQNLNPIKFGLLLHYRHV